MNNEKTIWNWINREVWLIGTILAVALFIWTSISALDKQVALQNQKLDTIIAWEAKHDNDTSTWKQELNSTFAYIYEKLGSKFIVR